MTYQVAEAKKTLCPVGKLCDRGNRVIFGKMGGVIQNMHNGSVTPFRREGGIYVMGLWLGTQREPHFRWQG